MKNFLTKLSILSILGLIMTGTAFAAVTETFTTSVVQANVVEVRASTVEQGVNIRSTQVGILGNGDTVTIVMADNSTADCAITLGGTDTITITCDDGTTGGTASTTSQLATVIIAETEFTATGGDTTPVIAGVATLAGGVDPVALIIDYAPSASIIPQITYRSWLDANSYVYVTVSSGDSVYTISSALSPLMNADKAVSSCSLVEFTNAVRCTAATPGTVFLYDSEAVDEVAPVITSSSTINADENQTAAITIAATDNDAVATYSIIGGSDQALFNIDGATGVVTFISAPNFEIPTDNNTDNLYDITVQTSDDSANLSSQQLVSITVVNVNESPVITSSASASVSENQTSAMTVVASDPDAGDTVTYSIFGGLGGEDVSSFSIDASTGVLTFITAPDYENPTSSDGNNTYKVNVKATDTGLLSDITSVSIYVTDDVTESLGRSGGSGRVSSERLKEIFGKAELQYERKSVGVQGKDVKEISCGFVYSRLIKYGIHGEDVKALQTLLNSLGFDTGIIDGWYGPNTFRGIKSFQTAMGILKDGIVGPQTTAKLTGKCSA